MNDINTPIEVEGGVNKENAPGSTPPVQTVELRLKPSQIAIAGITLIAVIGAVLLVFRLLDLLIVVFVALVIAATLRPIVAYLQRRRIPKALALALIYLSILGMIVGMFVLVIPVLAEQGGALVRSLPKLYSDLVFSLENNPIEAIRTLPQRLPSGDQLDSQLQAVSSSILTGALGISISVLAFLAQVVSIIVLSIYLTLDQSRLERFWLSVAPSARRQQMLSIWREIESRLGGYVRGQLLLMLSIGVISSIGYLVIGLPFPLALGVLAGLFEFIPMVGPILGAIPAVIVALSISPQAALLVVLFTVVVQMAENHILVPRLMGRSVGVSPIVVILAVFAFTSLLGFAGAFLAIPLAAILQVLVDQLVIRAGGNGVEEPVHDPKNIMTTMRAKIRRLRAEGLQRLRNGNERIMLSKGDRDDVDSQVDDILRRADQSLTAAAQTAGTDTEAVHAALLAKVDLAIHQAGEMVDEAAADTVEAEPIRVDSVAEGQNQEMPGEQV